MRREARKGEILWLVQHRKIQGGPKTDTQFYFWDNLGNSGNVVTQ